MLSEQVELPIGEDTLSGDLVVPGAAGTVVLFAHGSGSSRHSPRNRAIAGHLQRSGLGTLLLDLLTRQEERADALSAAYRFDVPMLGRRLVTAVDWLGSQPATARLTVGLFGASTGAAAALRAAARRPERVRAVVSRGGRPDLAGASLGQVRAPVLMIVGGLDGTVLELNRQAAARLAAPHRIAVVAGAGHLFEELGALEEVAELTAAWFRELNGTGAGNAPG
ncbi:dienelactone hydrolase family protein [Kitasatospora sp. NPDC096147]|uniref:dienelactone hydrolase family protein n=1 Tax=Kitasatospora sp. NPDC096147 TaxID=3364093 RepID=UPI0038223D78